MIQFLMKLFGLRSDPIVDWSIVVRLRRAALQSASSESEICEAVANELVRVGLFDEDNGFDTLVVPYITFSFRVSLRASLTFQASEYFGGFKDKKSANETFGLEVIEMIHIIKEDINAKLI